MLNVSILGLPSWAHGKSEQYIQEVLRSVIRKHSNPPDKLEQLFVKWGLRFGVRPDVLAAISMLETGWWRFGGNATPDMNNPAGLRCKCNEEPTACRMGKNNEMYRAYPTLDQGVAHFAAHLYCYTHAQDSAGAQQYDPCWATWYYPALQKASQYGLAPDSIDACYSIWRDGVLPPTTGGQQAIASIKSIVEEFERSADGIIVKPDSAAPSWLLPIGLGLLAILLWQGGQSDGK